MSTKNLLRLCEETAAEGCVLLENKNEVLPLKKGEKIAVFGRIQADYYKSGTGSGGLVNTEFVIGIMDALLEKKELDINKNLYQIYNKWMEENPFDMGQGWATEPWCQKEMEVSEELAAQTRLESDTAIVIIGRTAGEDHDNTETEGSYLLSAQEEQLVAVVRKHFDKMVVVLNVGNIIDMKWVEKYDIPAVLYVWQGGMVGGNAVSDILTGKENPSGKLPDTIVRFIQDYPSYSHFGDLKRNFYAEDIYVGYRYFETFAKDKVQYPFGYGLSYSTFETNCLSSESADNKVKLNIEVTNTGKCAGKEVVQVYYSAPQGKLGKPKMQLAAFAKTKKLAAEEKENFVIEFPWKDMASYDDGGQTAYPYSYVLEKGEYIIYAGNSVRDCKEVLRFEKKEDICIERLSQALAPVLPFERIKPEKAADGQLKTITDKVPLRQYDLEKRILEEIPAEISDFSETDISLLDVAENKEELDTFIAGLSKEELCCIVRAEGMCSPKVTPGTASAFGGLTKALKAKGIPAGCCADGPSGIRMDCGTLATSLPSGTCIASSFNTVLTEELFEEVGLEVAENKIDILLGPGINIHRFPLNGRNFEYFSEDPILTGKMAAAQLRGMHKNKVTGALKHFAANSQENKRTEIDAVISERALREIYLKGFEIAVKEGDAKSIMTMYGAINGIWAAGNYDLNTWILRKEWGFSGIVMTDWWAKMNDENEQPDVKNAKAMVRAQNDLYMVVEDALTNSVGDNLKEAVESGDLKISQLQRCAANICRFLLDTHAMERMMHSNGNEVEGAYDNGEESEELEETIEFEIGDKAEISLADVKVKKGLQLIKTVWVEKEAEYMVTVRYRSEACAVAQIPICISMKHSSAAFMMNGTENNWKEMKKTVHLLQGKQYLNIFFGQLGIEAEKVVLERI